ncbi:hypothetical protein VTI74DRAFT_216 [Chaetomium olivicolor]
MPEIKHQLGSCSLAQHSSLLQPSLYAVRRQILNQINPNVFEDLMDPVQHRVIDLTNLEFVSQTAGFGQVH